MENKVEGEVREGLEAINSTGRSLIRFVEAYRKVTRIPTPRLTSFYVKPFLERMAKLAEPYTRKENASVRLRVTPSDLLVYADEDLIGQVVLNLLKNAAHAVAGKPDGEIVVTAYCTETEQVAVDVTDNGCGIPADVAANIFVPFFTTKPNGSGIGLSVSRQIMRMHNGSIMLKHSLAGKTTFMLLFN
jgi:C4-dicarboxylate-specific signal transduction histidine kinase